jgi:carbonic anhydrase
MVLGHSQCGAVKAALKTKELALPESIRDLVRMVSTGGEKGLDRAIVTNVRAGVAKLKNLEPPLASYIGTNGLKVVGGVYDLASASNSRGLT